MRARGAILLFALVSCSRAPATTTAPASSATTLAVSAPTALPTASAPPTPSAPVVPLDPPGVYMGRTIAQPMSWRGADWLDRPTRDDEQKPEHVLDVLGVRQGQSVADVGCGSGYFTMHLSRRVGATGHVLATDLQQEMLDLLAARLADAGASNVAEERVTADDAKLPRASLDLVLLVDVYHELPNPPATLAQIKASLKPGGRLALVEYRAEDPKVAIKPEHKTTLAQLQRELAANGWRFLASDESLPEQRIVTFAP